MLPVAELGVRPSVELLRFEPQSERSKLWFAGVVKGAADAGLELVDTTEYRGSANWLMLWGAGAPSRGEIIRRHLVHGGHVLCCDLAYWQRETKVRVSIDGPHPQAWVMERHWPSHRLKRDGVSIRNHYKPDGPVIVAGIGKKATQQYGPRVATWEKDLILQCQARWPKRKIYYRPKANGPRPGYAIKLTSKQPIESVLAGASLVVTWHSNVAIDALRMGIPVVCRDGAAAAVCPSALDPINDPEPLSVEIRNQFLANLAWFQWAPNEAALMWAWLEDLLRC